MANINLLEEMRCILGFKSWWSHQDLFFRKFEERLANSMPIHLFLSVPCGWGKTEAATIPFLSQFLSDQNDSRRIFSSRMIYVLPSCVLVDQVADRIKRYLRKILCVKPHNGIFHLLLQNKFGFEQSIVEKDYGFHREPPAEIYSGFAITTTLDSFSARLFPSLLTKPKYIDFIRGRLLRSYLVFDEIHSYDLYTLGFLRGLLGFLNRLKTPHAIMTATLNKNQQSFLGINPSTYSIVEERRMPTECCKISLRQDLMFDGTKEKLIEKILVLLEEIKNRAELGTSRILITCNTVAKAQYVYERIKNKLKNEISVEIIHSRFTGEDRKKKVKKVASNLRKRSDERPTTQNGIVVTTQVIESGTDISADYLITEMAPPDALIQRIGRCARELRIPVTLKKSLTKPGNVFIIPVEVSENTRENIHMKPYPWYWILCAQAMLLDTEGQAESIMLERLIDITPAVSLDGRALVVQHIGRNLDISEFLRERFGATFPFDKGDVKDLLQDVKQGQDEFEAWLRYRMMIAKPISFPRVRESERFMILVYALDEAKELSEQIEEAKIEADYKELKKLRRELRVIEEKCVVPIDAQALGSARNYLQPIKGINVFHFPKNMYVYDHEKGLIIKGKSTNG
jgi:CRISPR-associated helicase Cas3